MRHWIPRLVLPAAILLIAAAGASAQDGAPAHGRAEWGVFPGGGVLFGDSSDRPAPDFTNYTFGTSFAWNVNTWFGIETEAGFGLGGRQTVTLDNRTLTAQPMPDTIVYTGNVVANPVGSDRAVVPYVSAGAGALRLIARNGTEALGLAESQTLLIGEVGAGVKWYSGRAWGIRGDYRVLAIEHHDEAPTFFGGEGTRYAHRIYAGVFVTF